MDEEIIATAATLREDAELTPELVAERTRHFARPLPAAEGAMRSVLIFRIGAEWLALPTSAFEEVASVRSVHSLPHRRGAVVRGVTNVRGELLICISLAGLLGIQGEERPSRRAGEPGGATARRLLVLSREKRRLAVPVDEVHGTHRFSSQMTREIPATVALAATRFTSFMLEWRNESVGCLDAESLFNAIERSLA